MRVTKLTFLAFHLNGAIGSRRYDFSVEQIVQWIDEGTILDRLEKLLGNDFDLSVLDASDRLELLREWQDLAVTYSARKMGVTANAGLSLLLAYLLEGVQRRLPPRTPTRSSFSEPVFRFSRDRTLF